METIVIAVIVSLSTLGGVYLGMRLNNRYEPKNELIKEDKKESSNVGIESLFNFNDSEDEKVFKDLQKALNFNGKVNEDEDED